MAILARDGVEHLDVFFACGKLGAIHTAFNWRLHWREHLGIIANTTPKILFYSDEYSSVVAEIDAAMRGSLEAISHYVHLEGGGFNHDHSQAYQAILEGFAGNPGHL